MSTTTATRERPIVCTAQEVRAILDGRQTQLRRPLHKQPPAEGIGNILGPGIYHPTIVDRGGMEGPGPDTFGVYDDDGQWCCPCLFGAPGDTLWVKEQWQAWTEFNDCSPDEISERALKSVNYLVNGNKWDARVRSAQSMPRAASRLALEITNVTVEQDAGQWWWIISIVAPGDGTAAAPAHTTKGNESCQA